MASVAQLGYLGLSVRDVDQWEQFAAQVHTAAVSKAIREVCSTS